MTMASTAMIPGTHHEVTQTILADPDLAAQGVYGNCLQAAVASVLNLPLDAVPHFVLFTWWPAALELWARGRGLLTVVEQTDMIPDRLCIVGGKSPREGDHAVVGQHGRIVWDPHPSRTGLASIRDVTYFVPWDHHVPCALCRHDSCT